MNSRTTPVKKRFRFSASYWYILGTAEAYAELIERGVRPLAQLTLIFRSPSRLNEQLPHLLDRLKEYQVKALRRTVSSDASHAVIHLVLYSATDPANRRLAAELLGLFKQLGRKKTAPDLKLHREDRADVELQSCCH